MDEKRLEAFEKMLAAGGIRRYFVQDGKNERSRENKDGDIPAADVTEAYIPKYAFFI